MTTLYKRKQRQQSAIRTLDALIEGAMVITALVATVTVMYGYVYVFLSYMWPTIGITVITFVSWVGYLIYRATEDIHE